MTVNTLEVEPFALLPITVQVNVRALPEVLSDKVIAELVVPKGTPTPLQTTLIWDVFVDQLPLSHERV